MVTVAERIYLLTRSFLMVLDEVVRDRPDEA